MPGTYQVPGIYIQHQHINLPIFDFGFPEVADYIEDVSFTGTKLN